LQQQRRPLIVPAKAGRQCSFITFIRVLCAFYGYNPHPLNFEGNFLG